MKDLVAGLSFPVRYRTIARWSGVLVGGALLSLAVPLAAAAYPTPGEVSDQVVGCAAGGLDLSDCVDLVQLAIYVEAGIADLPLPSSGNPPIPPVPPVPQT